MTNTKILKSYKRLTLLCLSTLIFLPTNMLITPILDFYFVQELGDSWTITKSAFVILLMLSVFFAFPLRFLTSFEEKFFLRCAVLFFLYTILLSVCVNGISFYPF
jgi:hypothetical protein